MPNLKYLVVAGLLMLSVDARADWADPSAAYRCDRSGQSLLIRSVMETSSPEDPGEVKAPKGLVPLVTNNKFQCAFGQTSVRAKIRVRGPQPTGMYGGMTQTYFESSKRGISHTTSLIKHGDPRKRHEVPN